MKIAEMIPFIDQNQKIIIEKTKYCQLFSGTAREFNRNDVSLVNMDIKQIYLDNGLYTSGHIIIRVWNEDE